ncbi:MAG: hypothetical protein NT105_13475 [Verrucomicrobia bacterium]|nr:hypothetical protein [Verrucomicrobiota bacterium]
MSFRNPQFFTLNCSLLTSLSRTLLLLAMAWAVADAGEFHAASGTSKAKTRQEWIAIMSSWLKSYRITSATPVVSFKPEPRGDEFGHYVDKDGLIRFPNGEWVLVATHSEHQEEGRTRLIGDICLALTSRGELFENDTHACPGVMFQSKTPITSLETFLVAKGKLVPEGKSGKWKKVEVSR